MYLTHFGWHSRGYLPHFDGCASPQFITLHLEDSLPFSVIEQWQRQLTHVSDEEQRVILQRRIEKYLDMGYGKCVLKDPRVATIVQQSLLNFDQVRYHLFAWVIMPNHTHSLLTRFEDWSLRRIMHSHKSFTAHEINKLLNRDGSLWMKEYFDRYIRTADHLCNVVRYIEHNPVKAGLCLKPSDWPFSSAWFRKHSDN